jgi:hypothetical protein
MAQLLRQRLPVDALHTITGAVLDAPAEAPLRGPHPASPDGPDGTPCEAAAEAAAELERPREAPAGVRLRLVSARPRPASMFALRPSTFSIFSRKNSA